MLFFFVAMDFFMLLLFSKILSIVSVLLTDIVAVLLNSFNNNSSVHSLIHFTF